MQLEQLKKLLLEKNSSYVHFPFGEIYMVFKILDKVFAIIAIEENPLRINLKCEPNDAIAYRDIYDSVIPGYHMNKKHWNTIILDGSVPLEVLKDMIDQSYDLVFAKLTKKQKQELLQK